MNLHSTGHAIGMAWYLRRDYRRIVEIMDDGERFPPSFDAWLGIAETLETKFSDCGLSVIRVTIEPETFLAWRAARGLPADAALRDLFASECAFRQRDQTHEGEDKDGRLIHLTANRRSNSGSGALSMTTKRDQAAPSGRKPLVKTAVSFARSVLQEGYETIFSRGRRRPS
jgi:hypothetical protein